MRKPLIVVWLGLISAITLFLFPQGKCFTDPHQKTGWVGGITFGPDARYFASDGMDAGIVTIWETASCRERSVLRGPHVGDRRVAFGPDGKLAASGGGMADNAVVVWDAEKGKELFRLQGHSENVYAVAFSPDGRILASGGEDALVLLWDLASHKVLQRIPSNRNLPCLAFSPDGSLLAIGGHLTTGTILWDVKKAAERRTLKSRNAYRLLFSPDGKNLCLVTTVSPSLWDVDSGCERTCERPKWLDDGEYIEALAFSPDSRTLAVGHERAIGLWDVSTGRNTIVYTDDKSNPYMRWTDRFWLDPDEMLFPTIAACAFKENGDLIVVGTLRRRIALWQLTTVSLKYDSKD